MIGRFVLVLALSVAASRASAETLDRSPRDVVVALYKEAARDNTKEQSTSPFYDTGARRKFFTRGFDSRIVRAEATAAKAGAEMLDFDPISNSQDAELKDVKVMTDHIDGDTASVSASFTNYGHGSVVTYRMVKEDHSWKIDDIEGSADKTMWSVRKLLDE